ncbi:NAD(P)-dependent alcohol dehydrogenase [Streptomyces sp. DSM 41527]|uniref:NAD(P)-dependent alcohol dehydrogenase n=1 Tax=Streptomyces mooreae TaxID=3075523 RepID=A0ABU2T7Q7_9ACTN|nr:NAD(P)-dependent alcohol dehydrogenase [Streptomyces sp. DSM 41527]MDT0456395.1 NAD(P)-dependent alcohol dehydrogenase [Streptomyces sp. DSM 41527]
MTTTSGIPTTMRAAVLHGPGKLSVENRPVPAPGPGEVLVRVEAVGTCGSDVHYYREGRIGDFVVREPLVLGHEAAGTVVTCGPGTDERRTGRRVSIEPGTPCGSCGECRPGRYNLCPDMRFLATPPVDGAFCEYLAVREEFAHEVPDTLTIEEAALLEPLSVAVWACRKARVAPGDRVLITGAGPIGLVAAQTARAFGAREVLVTDVLPHRLELARAAGATALDVSRTPLSVAEYTPTVLLECSGVPAVSGEAIRTVGRAGRVVLIGMGGSEAPLPVSRVQNYELELTGTFRYAHTWPTAMSLVESGRVRLDSLVSHGYGLAEAESALTVATHDATAVKAVIYPQR